MFQCIDSFKQTASQRSEPMIPVANKPPNLVDPYVILKPPATSGEQHLKLKSPKQTEGNLISFE